jgi:drug/metabolite transporter (DMT)-like permease
LLSIFYGLLSALVWGGADFAGGLASRSERPIRVVTLAETAGLVLLIGLFFLFPEPMPPVEVWVISGIASVCGTVGIILLYRALAEGQMSIAAPVSALMGAIIPVVVSSFTEALPGRITFLGFVFALASIWLISQDEKTGHLQRLSDLRLPLLSGVGFGLYFVLIHGVSQDYTLWPLIASRSISVPLLIAFALITRQRVMPQRSLWPLASLGGLLDVTGNIFYVLAGQVGRMDVAVVLVSLYPASTVMLASIFLKERINRTQSLGVVAALLAIVLMAI